VFLPTVAAGAWDSFQARQQGPAAADPAHRLTNLSGGRRNLWEVAVVAFRRQPLLGEGAGSYEFVWNRDERWSQHARDAHSVYLEALAETGLPGALLLVLALGVSLVVAVTAPSRQPAATSAGAAAGCAAALLVFCITAGVDWMWESTAITAGAIACAGLALAAGSREPSRRRVRPRVAEACSR
jgi:O-antigen ligase